MNISKALLGITVLRKNASFGRISMQFTPCLCSFETYSVNKLKN